MNHSASANVPRNVKRVTFAEAPLVNAPYPGFSPKNAPPRFLHLYVYGGNLANAFSFRFATTADAPSGQRAIVRAANKGPVSFGEVTWGSRTGVLMLAPPY